MLGKDPEKITCEPCAAGIGFILGFMLAFFLFGTLARHLVPMDDSAIRAAVQAGKAEYYLDINDDRQWRWKP